MKYPKPELFKPSLEDQKRVAEELAGHLSSKVGVVLTDGSVVRGNRDQMKVTSKKGKGLSL
jgi:hypothetical protein